TPQPPGNVDHPMRDLIWPAFRSGELAISWQSVLDKGVPSDPPSRLEARGVPREAWNLGLKAGFPGLSSLIPLVLCWIAGGVLWVALGALSDDTRHSPRASGVS